MRHFLAFLLAISMFLTSAPADTHVAPDTAGTCCSVTDQAGGKQGCGHCDCKKVQVCCLASAKQIACLWTETLPPRASKLPTEQVERPMAFDSHRTCPPLPPPEDVMKFI